jgi:Tol biopolymer transport system component
MLLVACSGGSAPRASQPEPTTATLSAPAGKGSALAPLSGRIVFDNHEDVWSINASGTDLTRLTHSPGYEFDPSWSPDGTQIAYRFDRGDESEIWVMNADGTGQRRLTAGLSPAWSPDGSFIAYSSPGHDPNPPLSGISIMNADGSGQHRVPYTDGGEYPSWSPDEKRIAFNSNLTGDHVMYIVDVDGSNLVDLSSVGEGWQVQWSPDGRSILFTSHRDHPDELGIADVYVMRPDGSAVRRLTYNRAYTPAWSPDGSHIVLSAPGLFVMRANGTGIEKLPVDGVGETSLPDWR